MFGGNFAPRGYAQCNGQLLPIAQNTALFSILGTTYGGNGQTTFALPDLRGRVPINWGQGPGLPPVSLGEQGGSASHTLIASEMPAHNHLLTASSNNGNNSSPENNFLSPGIVPTSGNAAVNAFRNSSDGTVMNTGAVSIAGGSQPFDMHPPYLAVTFIIAIQGIFPSRN